ncbi:GPP34 family phosphoprotein [Pseudoclavibacter terrae]|uniref:GPP34 family phosphoprotein n=1 Tax=Pseudoclavibacter terrae TaxID=1530195 RepID=UPI003A5C783E
MDTAGEATVTVPQAVFLLALDDETGRPLVDRSAFAQVLSAAGLIELIMLGRLRIADQQGPRRGWMLTRSPARSSRLASPSTRSPLALTSRRSSRSQWAASQTRR